MGWLTSFAILMYLSLLCSPTPAGAHESGVSSPIGSALQAISPAQHQYALHAYADIEDQPSAAIIGANNKACAYFAVNSLKVTSHQFTTLFFRPHQPREPPAPPSLLIISV